MIVNLGDFLFKYRNVAFPFLYVTLFLPCPLVTPVLAPWFYAIGVGIATLGQGLRVLTIGMDYIVRGGRDKKVYAHELVQTGLFAHCRNPLYLGNVFIIIGLGIAANSEVYLFGAVPLLLFFYVCIILAEERFLRCKFGENYTVYCERVRRIVPRLTGIKNTVGSHTFNSVRVIVKEYGTLYLWGVVNIGLLIKVRVVTNNQSLSLNELRGYVGIIFVMTVLYLSARVLKKSHRLNG